MDPLEADSLELAPPTSGVHIYYLSTPVFRGRFGCALPSSSLLPALQLLSLRPIILRHKLIHLFGGLRSQARFGVCMTLSDRLRRALGRGRCLLCLGAYANSPLQGSDSLKKASI